MNTPTPRALLDLAAILDRGPAVIYTVDPASRQTLSITANVERELGYTPAEFLGEGGIWRTILHPEDAPRVLAALPMLFARGELTLEYRLRRKDGRWRTVRDEMVLRCGPGGEPLEIVGCAFDIEDRRQAQERRHQESCLFEAMFRRHVAVMLTIDPVTLDILDANEAASAFYGYSPAQLKIMNFRNVCLDGRDCHQALMRECEELGCRMAVCKHRLASGEERSVDIRVSRVSVAEREVLFAVVSDITARLTAEEALRQSEARLRSLYENSREGMFQSTPEGKVLWVNPAMARIMGYPSTQAMVESISDLGVQVYEDPAQRLEVIGEILGKGYVDRHEIRLRKRDGSAICIALTSWAVRDEASGSVRIEGVVQDITARKRAESERMLLATAVEQASEGMAILSGGTWLVEYANPAFGAITGLARPDILGQDFFGLFAGAKPPLPVSDIQAALLSGLEWTGLLKQSGGLKPLMAEAVFSPIRDSQGQVKNAVALLHDVSSLDRLEKRLRRAHKLEAMGTMAGGIAHDFNNILTPILLNAEVARQMLEKGDLLHTPLEEIIQAGGRARQLIQQILAFSRRGDLRASRIELAPIVREALRLARQGLPPDVTVRLEEGPEGLAVLADPSLVHQMVANLAENALYAMQDAGGTLLIRLDARRVTPGQDAARTALTPGDYASLTVADTGHGMDESLLERIFTPFFTTKRPGEGTGMGLSAVYGTARSLGGAVRVESELGKGSLFEVLLPLAGPDPSRADRAGLRRALVVDTQAFSRQALAMTLHELGYKVTTLREGGKALRVFSRAPERFGAVLAGEDLHGMSGHVFLNSCRCVNKGARLILMAGRDASQTPAGAADAVLQKPVGAKELAQALAPDMNQAPNMALALNMTQAPDMAQALEDGGPAGEQAAGPDRGRGHGAAV